MYLSKTLDEYGSRYVIFSNGKIYDSKKGEYLKTFKNNYGYVKVNMNGRIEYVHRLVCKAFTPNPENKSDVNHIDGNKENNHYMNLEWTTRSENVKHQHATGLANKFIGDHTKELVYSIMEYLTKCDPDEKTSVIAKKFGVDRHFIEGIYHRKRFANESKGYKFVKLKGQKGHMTIDDVKQICQYLEDGKTQVEISKITGYNTRHISDIKRRVRYTDISKDYDF